MAHYGYLKLETLGDLAKMACCLIMASARAMASVPTGLSVEMFFTDEGGSP
jgi:hypothetical protein